MIISLCICAVNLLIACGWMHVILKNRDARRKQQHAHRKHSHMEEFLFWKREHERAADDHRAAILREDWRESDLSVKRADLAFRRACDAFNQKP
jgi:hypothetical protein